MKKIIKLSSILAASMFAATFTLNADSEAYDVEAYDVEAYEIDASAEPSNKYDIVDTASTAGNFKVLLTAADAVGLIETLKSEGPYTIFAPTDEAFAKLPEGMVDTLLMPENRDELISILTYHVVPGKIMAADVKTGSAPTVNGTELTIEAKENKVTIDGIKVVATDIDCTNGVIHVVEEVILPASKSEIATR